MTDENHLPKKSGLLRNILIIIGLALLLALFIIFFRIQANAKLRVDTNRQATLVVATLVTKPGPASEKIILPATVQAWHDATIYARTNGYIKKWYVDIGSRVKEGDLLAEIEAPEVNAQLHQAEADLNTAIANENIAAITAKRWVNLLKTASVSKQETDEKVSSQQATAALKIAAQANRDRLRDLVSYERVIAPFDGVISQRNIDIGSLINAGSGTNVFPLFHIVQSHRLRAYVQIPQTYVANIKPDMEVSLHFSEHPGKSFPAKLYKTADAINPASLTLLAQFWADNPDGELLPGGYTEMHFKMPLSQQLIRIPVNALLFRSDNLQVAVVDGNNTVKLRSITVSRDFGNEVEVNTGLKAGERIVLNPPDSLLDGQKVRLAPENNEGLKEPTAK
ncbi:MULTISPECIES: efflux RND transporter periplasmic adaptor subunit [Legionella]|uniref:Membrane-fusion protein involved in transport n=1 Tax=Legionella maceachernii TaxID=466 RepID=A0A0W0W7A8_9GAMM|nr:efflux RND transporter periplasmic adaptor subunit [Legionella maceachernii]KTD28067.1 membrane-fusion protein involved in transport [Legionella maceachernii]SKA07959.1 RND family efflux transporter, MFP subunit [Legionella maceachernii]SUO99760.1 Multidrug resistance protein MdtE precursor [Legionella maceachernii]